MEVDGALQALGGAVDALEKARPESVLHVADVFAHAAKQLCCLRRCIEDLGLECTP